MKTKYLFIATSILILTSCSTYKKNVYMQLRDTEEKSIFSTISESYKIKPGDILYIKVISGNEEIDKKFSVITEASSGSVLYSIQNAGLYYSGFFVNDSGFVQVPFIGNIKLQGLTIQQAQDKIKDNIDQYLENALVMVKLNSIRFTILGMINHPGIQTSYTNKLTVFDAISMAGDIPLDGVRYKVNILRENENGIIKLTLDLTDITTIENEGYYIMNNDIIYIEPRKLFFLRSDFKDFLLFAGSTSSVITALFVILNYISK